MRKLISDLLTFAREGGGVHEREVIDIEIIAGTCWRNVATSEASLTVDIDRRIHADWGRLKQLLENLMRNATEHGPDDVSVVVELPRGFYVEDDGIANKEEELFSQVDDRLVSRLRSSITNWN